jgi:hypothetical protein
MNPPQAIACGGRTGEEEGSHSDAWEVDQRLNNSCRK